MPYTFYPKSFFKRVNKDLLKGYFTSRKVMENFPWNKQWSSHYDYIESLDEAYHDLAPAKRESVEEELRDVVSLCKDDSQETLRAVCQRFNILWDDEMTPEDRILHVLLENKDAFETACNWCDLESYSGFIDCLGPSACEPKEWKKTEKVFRNHFSMFFQNSGCGQSIIDYYKDTEREGYLVTYEARIQNVPRFDKDGQLVMKPERPVLESLMIYYPKLGKLKLKVRNEDMAKFVSETFAKVILDKPDFFLKGPANPVYDFSRFTQLKTIMPHTFDIDPADGIEFVNVTALHFNPDELTKDIVTIRSNKNLPERIRLLGIDLSVAVIKMVNMRIKFSGKGKGRTKSVRLSLPNKNNLGDSKRDKIIENCLRRWGIEAKATD